jgi:antitoxin PrlF
VRRAVAVVPTPRDRAVVEILLGITQGSVVAVSVTSMGQVTIPKRIRDALGITPGSKVEFDVAGGGARLVVVRKQVVSRLDELVVDHWQPA